MSIDPKELRETKHCHGCLRDLSLACFNVDKRRPDGLRSRCRDCQAVYRMQYTATHSTARDGPRKCLHGGAVGRRSPEYKTWCNMKNRCSNRKDKRYLDYGGRGIAVCDEWRTSFAAFVSYVGRRPSPLHELDRIDNDGDYRPGNVRWATAREQSRNKRSNVTFVVNGCRLILADALQFFGLNGTTYGSRLRRGWSPLWALTTPANARFGAQQ